MTTKRKLQIESECRRRLGEWIKNESFDEMTCGGVRLNFNMHLGMMGYPFVKPKWMIGKKFNKFLTEKEFNSPEYDAIETELFNEFFTLNNQLTDKEAEKKRLAAIIDKYLHFFRIIKERYEISNTDTNYNRPRTLLGQADADSETTG